MNKVWEVSYEAMDRRGDWTMNTVRLNMGASIGQKRAREIALLLIHENSDYVNVNLKRMKVIQ